MAKRRRPVHSSRDGPSRDDDDNADAAEPAAFANTAQYYSHMLENYDDTQFTRKIYSDASQQLQGWIERMWYG